VNEMLATPQWLIAHHRDANVRVIDPRQPTDYDKGHVPGAVNARTRLSRIPTGRYTS